MGSALICWPKRTAWPILGQSIPEQCSPHTGEVHLAVVFIAILITAFGKGLSVGQACGHSEKRVASYF